MPPRRLALAIVLIAGCAPPPPAAQSTGTATSLAAGSTWCDQIPRETNRRFRSVTGLSDWFDVHDLGDGVYALAEPRQFQEVISYLIVGTTRALLFDTGLGMVPIRPVVERLTSLPVVVINSHTHYDHVGGNAEFDEVWAVDTRYTRANQAGFPHAELAGEVAATSLCGDAGRQVDTAAFRTRAWRASRAVADGDSVDLGGRVITVWQVPGHTPDAVALFDRAHGLLFTGDSYYEGPIWLYVPETDLDAYDRSISRLSQLKDQVRALRPAHNTVDARPERLDQVLAALRRVRAREIEPDSVSGTFRTFRFDGFAILTAAPLLEGRHGDRDGGGSGLTSWP